MTHIETIQYRGKTFHIPILSDHGIHISPDPKARVPEIPKASPILHDLNSTWNLDSFLVPRIPISLGVLSASELQEFTRWGVPRVLDMPIKFPGSDFRLPAELAQFAAVVQRVANFERAINPDCFDEYYCYLTVDQGEVGRGALQREAPCHVDGFQGARWNPKVKINHSYTVGDVLPTMYYPQPFDFSRLDETKHDFFWEMNRQVAHVNSAYTWQPRPAEITLMDAYSVHRGIEADTPMRRTWVRLSFEVRQFDRLGNAHNPLFNYRWAMVPRDIEALKLEAFDKNCDPTLRVFPWQSVDGRAHADRMTKTKPNLTPQSLHGGTWSEDLSTPARPTTLM